MEPADAAEHYTERLVRLPNLSIYYEPIALSPVRITRGELGMRPDAIVFWCGQSLYKYHPQHDFVFAKIAKLAGNCQFVFIKHAKEAAVADLFHRRLDFCIFGMGSDGFRPLPVYRKFDHRSLRRRHRQLRHFPRQHRLVRLQFDLRRASSIICLL